MEKLKEYKNIYLNIKVPEPGQEQLWLELKREMMPVKRFPFPFFRYGVVFLALLLLTLGSLIGFAQKSSPGSAIYPVKVLSDKVISAVKEKIIKKQEKMEENLMNATKAQPGENQGEKKQDIQEEEGKVLGTEKESKSQGGPLLDVEIQVDDVKKSPNSNSQGHQNQTLDKSSEGKGQIQREKETPPGLVQNPGQVTENKNPRAD